MKKIIPIILLSLVLFLIPGTSLGWCSHTPIVEGDAGDILGFEELFGTISNAINTIIFCLVPPIAVLMLIIGGMIFLFSGGSPEIASKGKKVIFATIIGMVLVYGSWLIINTIMEAIDYASDWTSL